MLRCRAF